MNNIAFAKLKETASQKWKQKEGERKRETYYFSLTCGAMHASKVVCWAGLSTLVTVDLHQARGQGIGVRDGPN